MIKKIIFTILIIMFSIYPVFAQDADYEPEEVNEFVLVQPINHSAIPHGIRNNEFFQESVRLNGLAREAFEFGDYDASAGLAEEAIRFAYLSNEFVSNELYREARRLLDWAEANQVSRIYPDEFNQSKQFINVLQEAHENENFDSSIIMAIDAIAILSVIEENFSLPSQFTVRPWATSRDCFWNIAADPLIYGDPRRWRVLYEANRSRLPNPNNPDIIRPGMVLDIPSISGEERSGMWSAR